MTRLTRSSVLQGQGVYASSIENGDARKGGR